MVIQSHTSIRWFVDNRGSRVGAILTRSKDKGYIAYIGASLGVNEDFDADHIKRFGAKLTYKIACSIFPRQLSTEIKEGVKYDGKDY